MLLDGEEADNVRGQTLLQDGYWVTGLDVFHQLHCLVRGVASPCTLRALISAQDRKLNIFISTGLSP